MTVGTDIDCKFCDFSFISKVGCLLRSLDPLMLGGLRALMAERKHLLDLLQVMLVISHLVNTE